MCAQSGGEALDQEPVILAGTVRVRLVLPDADPAWSASTPAACSASHCRSSD